MVSEDAPIASHEALPTPEHITLLLKHQKSTVLISVLPDDSFTAIKTQLLNILTARGITEVPGTATPLPETPDEIELGVLKDKRDVNKGWTLLAIKEGEVSDVKAGKRKVGLKKSTINENPAGAGLSDGSWLAYRVKTSTTEDEDAMTDILSDPGWDVTLPTYDDEPDHEEDVDPA